MGRKLRRPALLAKVGFSDATRHRYETAGEFPARQQLTKNIVVWDEDEIDEWLASRETITSENVRQVAPGCTTRGRKPKNREVASHA